MYPSLRHPATALLALLLGLLSALLGLGAIVLMAPDGDRDLRAYQTAARCPAAPSGPADCLWTQEFTVTGLDLTTGRGSAPWVRLRNADGDTRRVEVEGDSPILAGLDEGDRITGTVWRGVIPQISADGHTQKTYDAPYDKAARAYIGALILLPPGVLVMLAGLWRLVLFRRPEPTTGMIATVVLGAALFPIGLFSPVLAAGEEEDLSNTLVVWCFMFAIAVTVVVLCTVRKRSGGATAT